MVGLRRNGDVASASGTVFMLHVVMDIQLSVLQVLTSTSTFAIVR